MQKDQGCFCCAPTVPSGTYSLDMPSHHLQGQNLITPSCNSFRDTNHSFAADNISTDAVLSPWLQNISLSNPYTNHPTRQPEWDNVHGSSTPGHATHEYEMCQIQDSSGIVVSAVTSDLGKQSSFNFRILQNRELRGKISGNMVSEMKPLLSSFDASNSYCYKGTLPNLGCDNMAVNTNSSDSMDLDSALDELGMLSTVTNSRRQYLLETRGHASFLKPDRLRSKSESAPNLTTICHRNGYQIIQGNVTDLNGSTVLNQISSLYNMSPCKSEPSRLNYRNPKIIDETTERQRSVPRMSRMRKDRYMYRRSRCPYKIPNRLCSASQMSSFRPEYFNTCGNTFDTPASLSENVVHTLSGRQTQQLPESKSDNASPIKANIEVSLVRSLSAEDLAPICRLLEQELNKQDKASCDTEQNLDSVTSQMTYLHMS